MISVYAFRWLASVLYSVSLSMGIPLMVYVFFPHELISFGVAVAGGLAVLFFLASVGILYATTRSVRQIARTLAYFTLFPVILAVMVSLYPVNSFFLIAQMLASDAVKLQPLVENYVSHAVPRMHTILYVYAALGLGWFVISKKLRF